MMGSGAGGSYGGGGGGSQPYAPSYHVVENMHKQDIKNGTYHDGHYDKNPTAQNINDMINGNYVGNKKGQSLFLWDWHELTQAYA